MILLPDAILLCVGKEITMFWNRFKTAIVLIALLTLAMVFRGWVLVAAVVLFSFAAVYEEYAVITAAGHHPIKWPTWLCAAVCIPLMLGYTPAAVVPLLVICCLLTIMNMVFRQEPNFVDLMFSVLPMISVVLPFMCIVSFLGIKSEIVQITLLLLVFIVPVLGDTAAYAVGSLCGKHKLCPEVSKGKTVEGALAGLAGSLLGSFLIMLIMSAFGDISVLPWWHFALIGILGGVASQLGDLFASMLKRFCGVKDFSSLLPGHGGIMDRMDSILFMAVAMFCYRIFMLGAFPM